MQFNECGAGIAEAAIVFRQLAKMRALVRRQRAQPGLTVLGPGNHGGGMQRSHLGGAVTRQLTAAGLEVVDGAFDELTEGEQEFELTLVIVKERLEGLPETAGAIG